MQEAHNFPYSIFQIKGLKIHPSMIYGIYYL